MGRLHGADASQQRLAELTYRDLPLGCTLDHDSEGAKNVSHAMFQFAHEKSRMFLVALPLGDVAQHNGEGLSLVHFNMGDRSFRRKLVSVLMQGEDFLSLAHAPRHFMRSCEFADVLRVGIAKPFG